MGRQAGNEPLPGFLVGKNEQVKVVGCSRPAPRPEGHRSDYAMGDGEPRQSGQNGGQERQQVWLKGRFLLRRLFVWLHAGTNE